MYLHDPVIGQLARRVEAHTVSESSGHDWQHIYRVWQTALQLANLEQADILVVSLAALLHDMDDYKLSQDPTSEDRLPVARQLMHEAGIDAQMRETVCATIKATGYSKALVAPQARTLESHILSDADLLDAMGAVGIARVFAYGGNKQRAMFDPAADLMEITSREDYINNKTSSVAHFFEKLLKLKDLMHTEAGKAEALVRHRLMIDYLDAFFTESAAPAVWSERLAPFRI